MIKTYMEYTVASPVHHLDTQRLTRCRNLMVHSYPKGIMITWHHMRSVTLTIHRPSKWITSWKSSMFSLHHLLVLGLMKSGNATLPGHTYMFTIEGNSLHTTHLPNKDWIWRIPNKDIISDALIIGRVGASWLITAYSRILLLDHMIHITWSHTGY